MPEAALVLDARALSVVSRGPWTHEQLTRVVVANLVGVVAVATAAYGSTRANDTQQALLWFNIGVAAIGFVGIANARWLLQSRRVFTLGRNAVLEQLNAVLLATAEPDDAMGSASAVWSPGTHRYHERDCALARGRELREANAAVIAEMMLRPCEVCLP